MQMSNFDAFRTAAEGGATGGHRLHHHHYHRHHGGDRRRRPFTSTIHIPVSDGFMLHLMILFKLTMEGIINAIQTSWEWIADVIACFDFLLSPLMEEDLLIQLSIALILLDRSCASCLQIEQNLIQQAQEQQRQNSEALRQQMSNRQSHQLFSSSLESEQRTSVSPSSFLTTLIDMLDQAVLIYSKEAAAATTTKTAVADSTMSLSTTDRISGQNSGGDDVNGVDNDFTLALFLTLFGVLALVFSYYCLSVSISSPPSSTTGNRASHSSWLFPSSRGLSSSPVSTTVNHLFRGMMYSNGGGGVFAVEQYHNTTVVYMLLALFCIEGILFCFGSMILGYIVFDALFMICHNVVSPQGGREDMSQSSSSLFSVVSTTRATLWNDMDDCPPIMTTLLVLWGLCLLTSRWVRWQLYQSIGD